MNARRPRALTSGRPPSAPFGECGASIGTDDDSLATERVLAGSQRWLRFPAALEAEFEAAKYVARGWTMFFCSLLGTAFYLLGSSRDALLVPDVFDVVVRLRPCIAGLGLASSAVMLTLLLHDRHRLHAGRPVRRAAWPFETATLFNGMVTAGWIVQITSTSTWLTGKSHSAALLLLFMYSGIAVRQRFWYSLAGGVVSLVGYIVLMRAHSAEGQLILLANQRLLGVSWAITLIANYTFEHRERRTFLLERLRTHRQVALTLVTDALQAMALRDALTGLANRRSFDETLAAAWRGSASAPGLLALALFDIDHFKRYNDHHGHIAGDACLQRVATVIDAVARRVGGIAARIGGEEFALLLPAGKAAQALEAAEAVCRGVRELALPHPASPLHAVVTVSAGIAESVPQASRAADSLLDRADAALYRAKAGGRDRVEAAPLDGARTPFNALTTASPATAAVGRPPPAAPGSTERLADVRRRGHPLLHFPADVEAGYQSNGDPGRRQRLCWTGNFGILLFVGYSLLHRPMFPDLGWDTLWVLWPLSAFGTVAMACMLLAPLRWWMREALFSTVSTLNVLIAIWLIGQSGADTAASYIVVVVMVPMFSGIVSEQPFWFTCMPTAATLAGCALWFHGKSPQGQLIAADSVHIVAAASIFMLIGCYALEHAKRTAYLLAGIAEAQGVALARAAERLEHLSMTDALTDIGNRRRFEHDLLQSWQRLSDHRRPLSLLIVDVDHFKRYNDTHGHPAGDRCLAALAATLSAVARASSAEALVSRLGGEEFAVLLPGSTLDQAAAWGGRLCAAVAAEALPHGDSPTGACVTVSVGAACILTGRTAGDAATERQRLLALADAALYRAKASGRNRVDATQEGSRAAPP